MNKMVKTNWKDSEEKQMLKNDIIRGVVTADMTATAVYEMHDGAYKKYDLKNFKINLTNLRKFIKRNMEKAKDEDAVLANTLKGREAEYKASNKTWQSSKARKVLIADLRSGVTKGKKPKEIYESRRVYQEEYDLKHFRDNMNKEKRKPKKKQSGYWTSVQNNQGRR
jgi:hypothetical protein